MNDLQFDIEVLERRQMMAGNIAVRVSGGDLIINGYVYFRCHR